MDPTRLAVYAVACLEGLDQPATPEQISRSQNIPLLECRTILARFEKAGFVRQTTVDVFERSCEWENLTAFEILQAAWARPVQESCDVLFGASTKNLQGWMHQLLLADVRPQG